MNRKQGGVHGSKRTSDSPLDDVQIANRAWWEAHPMTYDWSGVSGHAPGDPEWFDDQDRRSDAEHKHFLNGTPPFERLLETRVLKGQSVLEIGVGSGYHAELLHQSGAHIAGVDISQPAIELTERRFDLKGIQGNFEQWDAEIDRSDFHERFDVIWSWGVIHHSAHTARIVSNAQRWLRPDGTFAGMVYHRDSSRLAMALIRDWIIGGNWRHSIDEALWRSTDGFSARFYPADQWRDLLLAFFEEAETSIQGLDVDAVLLPRRMRATVWRRLSEPTRTRMLERLGHFLFFRADRPLG